MSPLVLLYVDDSIVDIEFWQMYIENRKDITLYSADCVEDALEKFDPKKHNAALLDWNLPDGDALDIAKHIRSLAPEFPIIFISGTFSKEKIQQAQNYTPLACVEKTAGEESMEKVISYFMKNKRG